jgi:hypothetical protein
MTYSSPGGSVWVRGKTIRIKPRSWLAISFTTAEPHVDIDRSEWVKLVEVVGGVLTLGFLAAAIEIFVSNLTRRITAGIARADPNTGGPAPRVRRFGNPPTRFKIEQFEIHTDGIFIGISFRLEAPPANLGGIKSLPRNLAGRRIRYDIRLPFRTLADDPLLRIRWTVVDLESGNVLLNEDDVALNRSRFEFVPLVLGQDADRLAVVCRVYRALGPFTTELLNETIRLEIGPPRDNGAYVRWRSAAAPPQMHYDEVAQEWSYTGDRLTNRRSKIHRLDKPCRSVKAGFDPDVFDSDVFNELPFPISNINGNRNHLCDYCFFGGPASTIASL